MKEPFNLQSVKEKISTDLEKEWQVLPVEKCFLEGELRVERSFQFHLKIAQNKMINNC